MPKKSLPSRIADCDPAFERNHWVYLYYSAQSLDGVMDRDLVRIEGRSAELGRAVLQPVLQSLLAQQ